MSPDAAYGPTEPAPRCEAHQGLHAIYQGACVAVGAQVPRPFKTSRYSWECAGCGAHVYGLTVPGGRRFLMDERYGDPHVCPPPVRVQVDEDALASAIVRASRATREERRADATPNPAASPERREGEGPERMGLQTVPVWTDDGPT